MLRLDIQPLRRSHALMGPPWVPGKIALLKLNFSAASLLAKIRPPLGPLNVLWVVVVTTSAYGIGLGCSPLATRYL